jgi:site-specific DNA-methyltransferase (adenine-specific)
MNNVCHLIDNMEFMTTIPDKFYDLAIVDPPYGIDAGKMNMGGANSSRIKSSDWDNKIPDNFYFIELKRISRRQIIFGANYFSLGRTKTFIVWDKGECMYGRSFSECELAFAYGFDENAKIFKFGPNNLKDKKIHKCQKPIALYKWLLQNYAKPGWTIFDSHVGSGSIRIACHDMGFDFTGCENDTEYWKAQEERFKNHIGQSELFETQEIQQEIYTQNEIGE